MKSAEQWYADGGLNNDAEEINHRREVQLDAFKAGMTEAANVVSSYHHGCTTPQVRALFHKTILSARDNTKPLYENSSPNRRKSV